jgi:hypothetical protein
MKLSAFLEELALQQLPSTFLPLQLEQLSLLPQASWQEPKTHRERLVALKKLMRVSILTLTSFDTFHGLFFLFLHIYLTKNQFNQ